MKKLEQIRETLKSEFIGIDDQIDQLIQYVKPWYFNDISRPIVVNLWGLTGTGKTSIIRRFCELINLLHLQLDEKHTENGGEWALNESILTYRDLVFNQEVKKSILLIDEFHRMSHYMENGDEPEEKIPSYVWELLDTGVITTSSPEDPEIKRRKLLRLINNLKKSFSDDQLKKFPLSSKSAIGKFTKKSSNDQILEDLQLTYNMSGYGDISFSFNDDDDEDEQDSSTVLLNLRRRVIQDVCDVFRGDNSYLGGVSYKSLLGAGNLFDFITEVYNQISSISKGSLNSIYLPNCLIFISGNLDNAFELGSGFNDVDIDASIVSDLTSKTTVIKLKKALQQRFRMEQITRLGNNFIIFPSMIFSSFEKIYEIEAKKILGDYFDQIPEDLKSTIKKSILDEGIYPTQGTRPLLGVISQILYPILQEFKEGRTLVEAYCNGNSDLVLKFSGDFTIQIPLTLTALRSKVSVNLDQICVHEAGHAVVYHYLTGKIPKMLIGSVTGNTPSGYMFPNTEDSDTKLDTIRELKNDVIVSLAGIITELEFVGGDKDKCLSGSYSDIDSATDTVKSIIGSLGGGSDIYISELSDYMWQLPANLREGKIDGQLKQAIQLLVDLKEETKSIVSNHRDIIRDLAILLRDRRKLVEKDLKEFFSSKNMKTNKIERFVL